MVDKWTKIRGSQFKDQTLKPLDLESVNSPLNKQLPIYDIGTEKFQWVDLNVISVAQDESQSSTTIRNYQIKLQHIYTPTVSGIYIGFFTAELANNLTNRDTYIRFDVNDTTIINEGQYYCGRANAFCVYTSFLPGILTEGTAYTFRIKYYAASGTALIRRARIFLTKVGEVGLFALSTMNGK